MIKFKLTKHQDKFIRYFENRDSGSILCYHNLFNLSSNKYSFTERDGVLCIFKIYFKHGRMKICQIGEPFSIENDRDKELSVLLDNSKNFDIILSDYSISKYGISVVGVDNSYDFVCEIGDAVTHDTLLIEGFRYIEFDESKFFGIFDSVKVIIKSFLSLYDRYLNTYIDNYRLLKNIKGIILFKGKSPYAFCLTQNVGKVVFILDIQILSKVEEERKSLYDFMLQKVLGCWLEKGGYSLSLCTCVVSYWESRSLTRIKKGSINLKSLKNEK